MIYTHTYIHISIEENFLHSNVKIACTNLTYRNLPNSSKLTYLELYSTSREVEFVNAS